MENWETDIKKYWDRVSDSEWYRSLRTRERLNAIRDDPRSAFHPAMLALLEKYTGGFAGKKILLPSSGDNHAAFAFAFMRAKVTSADISARQLENAKSISERFGLDIEYVCDDTMTLPKIADSSYDLVYTSNGTLTWLGDLMETYRNTARVLKKGGYSAIYDIHPFNRPFTGEVRKQPAVKKPYDAVLPDLHWRVQDIVNAVASAGLRITEMAELPAVDASFWFSYDEMKTNTEEETKDLNDWKRNPMAAIPAWLALISQKPPAE